MDAATENTKSGMAKGDAGLRGRLFRKYAGLLAGLVCVALVANGLLDIWFSYREQRALLVRIQAEQARAAAAKISQFVKEIEGQMGWTTQGAWATGGIEQRRLEALRLLRQVPAITELKLLDAAGREQLAVSRLAMDVMGSQIDRSGEPAFVRAVAQKVFYGPVYFHEQSEPYMTVALAGTRHDGGINLAEVNLVFIQEVVSQIKVGERGYAYVIDANGRLIAHPDISRVLSNSDLSNLPQVRVARATTGSANDLPQEPVDGVRGERVLAAHAAVSPLGWFVFVELPVAEAFAPIYASVQRAAALLVGALCLAIFAGLALARRMIVPIEALRASAERIGRGELGQRISIKTGDELEALGDQFNSMAARLQNSYATLERKVEERTHQLELANLAKSRFIAVASHDLRQPLHALGLFVAQLRGDLEAAAREHVVDRVETSLAALNELFDALLDISKLDAGVLAINPVPLPIGRVLERMQRTFGAVAGAKSLALRIVPSGAWVRSDAILLERVLLNLVSNAVRYTRHGRVLIGCRRRAGNLQIEVWDTGPGIAAEQRERVFGEFVRLAESGVHEQEPGLGLGLAIVQRLCERMGHAVAFDTTVGRGSRFCVTLPLAAPQAADGGSRTDAIAPDVGLHRPLIMVVDDDALILEGVSGLLRGWNCRVAASDSAESMLTAIATWKGPPPDLIIADYSLPDGRSGIEAIGAARDFFGTAIPAFLVSGDTAPELLHNVRASGFRLLHKPVSPMALRAMLAHYLRPERMRVEEAGPAPLTA